MDLTAFDRFEQWLYRHEEPLYNAGGEDSGPGEALILQNRHEIKTFADMLEGEPNRETAVEIGIGTGGTHFLWRELYASKVISVEANHFRAGICFGELRALKLLIAPPISSVVLGSSGSLDSVSALNGILEGRTNLLFIDGNHEYDPVYNDHRLYSPLVAPGGIIAFHDAVSPRTGVPKFLDELGKTVQLNFILSEKSMQGIAWYRKETA